MKKANLLSKALRVVLALSMVLTLIQIPMIRAAANNVALNIEPIARWLDGSEMSGYEIDLKTIAYATDGNSSDKDLHFRYGENSGSRKAGYLEFDLGSVYNLTEIKMWRYYDGRNYDPTLIAVSETNTDWANANIVYSSDDTNMFGFGTDSVTEAGGYNESADGKTISVNDTGRYIRVYSAGVSDSSTGSHLVEFQAFSNDGVVEVPKPMENVDTTINIPTFDANGKVDGETHPDIVYFENGWHGYKYYMAITPNQNGNSQFENPCIAASNDGINWEVPEGIDNPLTGIDEEPKPLHNSDCDLVYNEEEDMLYLYYVWTNDGYAYNTANFEPSEVRLFKIAFDEEADALYSVNGVEPQTVVTTTYRYDMLSPSVEIGPDGVWRMWNITAFDQGYYCQQNEVLLRTSEDGETWSDPVSLKDTFDQPGYIPWHIDVQWVESAQEYWAIFPCYPDGGESGYTELFYGKSEDGIVWTTYENQVLIPREGKWDNNFIYRSTFLYEEDQDLYRLWYSAGSSQGWKVAYTENDYSDMIDALGEPFTPNIPSADLSWEDVRALAGDILYDGSWTKSTSENIAYSNEQGASATLTFYGTGIKWIGQKDVNFGTSNVYIDGQLVTEVNQNGPAQWGLELYSNTSLDEGVHTIKIEVKDGGTDKNIDVEMFKVCYDTSKTIEASDMIVNASATDAFIGSTIEIDTIVLPYNASNKTVTYKSSNTNVATVDSEGTVTTLDSGKATITVTLDDVVKTVEIDVIDVEPADMRLTVNEDNPLFLHHLYRQAFDYLPGPLQGGKDIQGFWDSLKDGDANGKGIDESLLDNQAIIIHASGEVKGNATTLAWYEEQFEKTVKDQIPFFIMVSNSGTSGHGAYEPPVMSWVEEMYDTYPNMMGVLFSENHNATAEWERDARSEYMREQVLLAAQKGGIVVYSDMNDNSDYIESVLDDQALFDTLKMFKDNFILLAKTTSAWGSNGYNSHESVVQGAWLSDICGNWGSLIDSWMWFIEGFGPLYGENTYSVVGGVEECRGPVSFPELLFDMRMEQEARVGATVFTFEHPDYTTSVGKDNGQTNLFTPAFTDSIVRAMEYMEDYDIPTKEEVIAMTPVAYSAEDGTLNDLARTTNLLDALYGDKNHNGYNNGTMMVYSTGRYGTIPSLPELATEEDKAQFDYVLTKDDVIRMGSAANIKAYFDKIFPKTYDGNGYAQYLDHTWLAYNSNWNIDSREDSELYSTQNVEFYLENNQTDTSITFNPYSMVLVDDQKDGEIKFRFNNYLVDKNPIWEGYSVQDTPHWNSDADTGMYDYLMDDYIPDNKTCDDIYRETTIVIEDLVKEPTLTVTKVQTNNDNTTQVNEPETTYNKASGTYTIVLEGNGWMEFELTDVQTEEVEDRLVIDNENPLLIFPVYGKTYNSKESVMQWDDTLLGRWEAIDEEIRSNAIIEIHGGMIPANQLEAFYTQQLEIAEANNIPVLLVSGTAGLVPQWTGISSIDDEWLEEQFQNYDCLKGLFITENYWTGDSNYLYVAQRAANQLRICSQYGGKLIWSEHQTQVIEKIVNNTMFKQALNNYGDDFSFIWKNTPVRDNAATAAYMQGLWLNGTIDQWGGLADTWKWFEKEYWELFNTSAAPYVGGGEECRSVVMQPEALLGIEMMSIYANGGTIYNFEHPGYTYGSYDLNSPAYTEVISETFKWILDNPAPSKTEILEDTKAVISGNISENGNNFHTDITMEDQSLPTYKTGRYGLIPAIPEGIEVNLDESIVYEFDESLDTYEERLAFFNNLYPETYEGNGFAQLVDDTWVIYNSKVNEDVDQSVSVVLDQYEFNTTMEPHTYMMVDSSDESIDIFFNNYRVDKDELWDGYTSGTTKWNADYNSLMQDWIRDEYCANPKDDTLRTTTIVIENVDDYKDVIVNDDNGNAKVTPVYNKNTDTLTLTIESNGQLDIKVQFNNKLPYKDVQDETVWYYGVVKDAYDKGLMTGTGKKDPSDPTAVFFEPTLNISRAMVATVLYRMEGSPDTEYQGRFPDVRKGEWYTEAVEWAASYGVVNGYKSGKFGPNDRITRQDLCIMLRNYAQKKGIDTSVEVDFSNFRDGNEVDKYAATAVAWCIENRIVSGSVRESGTFLMPKAQAKRCECAKMFSILDDIINK